MVRVSANYAPLPRSELAGPLVEDGGRNRQLSQIVKQPSRAHLSQLSLREAQPPRQFDGAAAIRRQFPAPARITYQPAQYWSSPSSLVTVGHSSRHDLTLTSDQLDRPSGHQRRTVTLANRLHSPLRTKLKHSVKPWRKKLPFLSNLPVRIAKSHRVWRGKDIGSRSLLFCAARLRPLPIADPGELPCFSRPAQF